MCLCLKRSLPHHIVLYIGGIKLSVCLSVCHPYKPILETLTIPYWCLRREGLPNKPIYVRRTVYALCASDYGRPFVLECSESFYGFPDLLLAQCVTLYKFLDYDSMEATRTL